jgi:endoglycosylceramidase
LSDGTTDPLVAYAAHGYDLVVDTKEVENPSFERVEFIFDRIRQTGERMNVPVMVGEWGAFHGKSMKMIETAQHVVNIFELYGFSNTYWCYYDDIEQYPYFRMALVRPFPQKINGTLISYDYNFDTGGFSVVWKESAAYTEPTVVYVPGLRNLPNNEVDLFPFADQIIFEYCNKSNAGKLYISPLGKSSERKLKFNILPDRGEEISIQ